MIDLLSRVLANPAAASLEDLRVSKQLLVNVVAICPKGVDFTVELSVTHAMSGSAERRDDPARTVTLTPVSRDRVQAMLRTVEEELRRREYTRSRGGRHVKGASSA